MLYRLSLSLKREADNEVMNASHRFKRLWNINLLSINNVQSNDLKVKIFLSNVAPKCLRQFNFEGGKVGSTSLLNVDYYSEVLWKIWESTTEKVSIMFLLLIKI